MYPGKVSRLCAADRDRVNFGEEKSPVPFLERFLTTTKGIRKGRKIKADKIERTWKGVKEKQGDGNISIERTIV